MNILIWLAEALELFAKWFIGGVLFFVAFIILLLGMGGIQNGIKKYKLHKELREMLQKKDLSKTL